eukprot:GFYU01042682.1.p1 GENE.GFYU01042682.1~~GFYU01042682.1.p1  ORF type:complete len:434 (+),score=101.84 GFYU01042682.1:65-1303(+)
MTSPASKSTAWNAARKSLIGSRSEIAKTLARVNSELSQSPDKSPRSQSLGEGSSKLGGESSSSVRRAASMRVDRSEKEPMERSSSSASLLRRKSSSRSVSGAGGDSPRISVTDTSEGRERGEISRSELKSKLLEKNAELAERSKLLTKAKEVVETLRTELKEEKERVSELEAKVKRRDAEIDKLRASGGGGGSAADGQRIKELEAELESKTSALQKDKQDNRALGRKLEERDETIRRLERSSNKDSGEVIAMKDRLQELEIKWKEGKREIQNLRDRNADLEHSMKLNGDIEIESLRARSQQLEELNKQLLIDAQNHVKLYERANLYKQELDRYREQGAVGRTVMDRFRLIIKRLEEQMKDGNESVCREICMDCWFDRELISGDSWGRGDGGDDWSSTHSHASSFMPSHNCAH